MHGHAAGFEAREDLCDFLLVQAVDLLERGHVVADAFFERAACVGLFRGRGQAVQQIAESELVGVAIVGVAFQASQKLFGLPEILAGQAAVQFVFELVEAIAILLEENPRGGARALTVAFVERRGAVHEHHDFAERGDALVHGRGRGGRCAGRNRGQQRVADERGSNNRWELRFHSAALTRGLPSIVRQLPTGIHDSSRPRGAVGNRRSPELEGGVRCAGSRRSLRPGRGARAGSGLLR